MKKNLLVAALLVSTVGGGCSCSTTKGKAKMVKTQSGLQYVILTSGTGNQPSKGKQVTVHYTGWLDQNGNPGQKFDSSVDRGMPFTFVIGAGQVIKGWDEGVMGMKVDEKSCLISTYVLG